jgi:hypothetical protein
MPVSGAGYGDFSILVSLLRSSGRVVLNFTATRPIYATEIVLSNASLTITMPKSPVFTFGRVNGGSIESEYFFFMGVLQSQF